jgi:RNA polymerase sigma factor (sigma-70 family)
VSRHNERTAQTPVGGTLDERRRLLEEAIERDHQELLGRIGFYLWRFGIATRESISERAGEVLHDTFVTALSILDKYDPAGSAKLWLLNVAVIVIKRKTREQRRGHRRLTLVADSEQARHAAGDRKVANISEAELFDSLLRPPLGVPSSQSPNADELLALVEGDDREILRLHYLEGLDGEELAAKFGVSTGVVYQRLSRARVKVRRAYFGEGN